MLDIDSVGGQAHNQDICAASPESVSCESMPTSTLKIKQPFVSFFVLMGKKTNEEEIFESPLLIYQEPFPRFCIHFEQQNATSLTTTNDRIRPQTLETMLTLSYLIVIIMHVCPGRSLLCLIEDNDLRAICDIVMGKHTQIILQEDLVLNIYIYTHKHTHTKHTEKYTLTITLSSHLILHPTQTKKDIVIDVYHYTCIDRILGHKQELLTHRGDTQQLLDQVLDIPDRHRAQHSALDRCLGRSVDFVLCDKCDVYLNDGIKMLENQQQVFFLRVCCIR